MMRMWIMAIEWALNVLCDICCANEIQTKCKYQIGKQFQHFAKKKSSLCTPFGWLLFASSLQFTWSKHARFGNCFPLRCCYYSLHIIYVIVPFQQIASAFSRLLCVLCVGCDRHWNKSVNIYCYWNFHFPFFLLLLSFFLLLKHF